MNQPRRHTSSAEISPYLPLKRALLRENLLSCSEQGFNILMGPLVELHRRLGAWLEGVESADEHWEVPALIRNDWVVRNVWQDPPEQLWCQESPSGHLLTPRPLFHLLNRLRHHPADGGIWVLTGNCTRDESAQSTLPLKHQRSFTMVEYAALAPGGALGVWMGELMEKLFAQAVAWDLPVDLSATDGGESGIDLRLRLPQLEPLRLSRAWLVPDKVLKAYELKGLRIAAVGSGVERWCLAILARYGTHSDHWPLLSEMRGAPAG
jgi:hypothetical protein